MTQVSSLVLARFARLARRSKDTWQGGLVRMPTWWTAPMARRTVPGVACGSASRRASST